MPRTPRPWPWKARDAWCVTVAGKRHILARGLANRAEADRAYHKLMLELGRDDAPRADARLRDLLGDYLDWVEANRAASTYDWYRRHLKSFVASYGDLPASKLEPHHVEGWVADQAKWNPSTRRGAIAAVHAAVRWAWKRGHLEKDPLAHVEMPPMGRRTAVMTPEQVRAVVEAHRPGDPFRVFLEVLRDTGARPGEVAAVTAAEVDLAAGVWVLQAHKTARKTGRPRVVHLTPAVVETCRAHMARWPDGPIFRNRDGRSWTRQSLGMRFHAVRKKLGLGKEAVSSSLRHGFATKALARNIPIATVAELLGHTSTTMVARVYGHLYKENQYLKDSLGKISKEPGTGEG